jgi:Ty3 transposon capsid-like protein
MSTKLTDVEAFDGKPDRLEIFIMQILGVMDIKDKKLDTDRKKITYTLGKFTDIAAQWGLNWMKGKRDEAIKNKTTPDYGTFQDFIETVGKTFSDPMEKERAHQSLKTYKQGGLPMHTFLAQFENLARKAEYFGEDDYLISLLKPACDGHLITLIALREIPLPCSKHGKKH